jgi:4-hydroxybenzoate polyprenyltransferase
MTNIESSIKEIYYFFLLSRPLNLLITLVAFALSVHIATGDLRQGLEDRQFWFACICLTVITATGYWVNDAFDFKIDRENRPLTVIVNARLSVKKVLTAYFIAVMMVLGLSALIQPPVFMAVNASAVVLLFLYAWFLKRTTVVGNIVIALLTALVVYYAALLYVPRTALMWTIMFAFEVTFIREVIKDMEDIKGDLQFNLQTLPIRIGIQGAKSVIYMSYVLFLLSCYLPILEAILRHQPLNLPYLIASILLVQIPAIYLIFRLRSVDRSNGFRVQSQMLKGLIFSGMVTILFL